MWHYIKVLLALICCANAENKFKIPVTYIKNEVRDYIRTRTSNVFLNNSIYVYVHPAENYFEAIAMKTFQVSKLGITE